MALLGQASGGFTESSSALRILHVGIRNTVGILTDDAFTQTNPPNVTATSAISQSAGMDTAVLGVLSGSIAFARGDVGSNYIGGALAAGSTDDQYVSPLGLFINTAVGNAYENTPGVASGKGPYVSSQGTYASSLYETQAQTTAYDSAIGDDIVYTAGIPLMASLNGYLTAGVKADGQTTLLATNESYLHATSNVNEIFLAVLKMPADSTQPEIVFDQRI